MCVYNVRRVYNVRCACKGDVELVWGQGFIPRRVCVHASAPSHMYAFSLGVCVCVSTGSGLWSGLYFSHIFTQHADRPL